MAFILFLWRTSVMCITMSFLPASSSDARIFQNDQLQRFYDIQTKALAAIEKDPDVAKTYKVAANVCDRGLSDCFDMFCSQLSNIFNFPKKTLFFTNHTALSFLRKELAFMDWSQHALKFEKFDRSVPDQLGSTMYLQYPKLTFSKVNGMYNWRCTPSVWQDIVQPSAKVKEEVKKYIKEDYFLVGIHIRSYWLLEHDVWYNNKFGMKAQDFLDCALSVRNIIETPKPIRYFLATDSEKIAEEWMEKVPNVTVHPGPLIHTGTMTKRNGKSLCSGQESCGMEEAEAMLKVFIDYFVVLGSNFSIQTHGSSWSRIGKFAGVRILDLEQKPKWCDSYADRYSVSTHRADIS